MDLATLRFFGVGESAIAKLSGDEILGIFPDSVLNVLTRQSQRLAVVIQSAEGHVDMAVFGIVMDRGGPLHPRAKISCNFGHQISREFFEIDSLAKFWRNDH